MSDNHPNDRTTWRVDYDTATFQGSHTADTETEVRDFLATVEDWTHARVYRQELIEDMEGE